MEKTMERSVASILKTLEKDPNREGLKDTPRRYSQFLREFCRKTPIIYTTFSGENYDEMIIQRQISFYSLCEHHLIPFFGTGTIAYIPNQRIVGISKLARTLEQFSRRLQNQERITIQVANQLEAVLKPKGVAVILEARHLCMEMRGIRKPGATTTTSHLTGVFKSRPETRAELLQLYR
jgi:GTP cyclohydrolase I